MSFSLLSVIIILFNTIYNEQHKQSYWDRIHKFSQTRQIRIESQHGRSTFNVH
jgi:hypothetical protein